MAIGKSAELGFDLIEMPALDPGAIDTDHTRRCLDEAGIGITMSLGLDAETDISSGDPGKVKRGEERLTLALTVARDVGATHVCGILYSALQKYFEPPKPSGVSEAIDVLSRICEEAAKSSITLGLEVVNRYETNVLNTAAQAVEMCKRIDAPNAKIHLDTYHMHIEEAGQAEAIRQAGDHLGYFHIGESHRGYLGTGSVDFESAFRTLVSIGYDGPITFESFSSVVTGQPLTGILAIWRNLWDEGEDLARHALEYTRAGMESAHEARAIRSGFDFGEVV
ncbi:MAG: sugar phosphate isomerase/epimerase [Rhodospirillaceae bacterium]|nr:sugar phosphate isomerase/epimerase [Rhodospirillaceae bacterium]